MLTAWQDITVLGIQNRRKLQEFTDARTRNLVRSFSASFVMRDQSVYLCLFFVFVFVRAVESLESRGFLLRLLL